MAEALEAFNKRLADVNSALKNIQGIKDTSESEILDYQAGKTKYLKSSVDTTIRLLKRDSWNLVELGQTDEDNRYIILQILGLVDRLKSDMGASEVNKLLSEVSRLISHINPGVKVEKQVQFIDIPELPEVISENVAADLNEIRRCFEAEAYRSAIILCGRVMETALQRKYYEVSGTDLAETSPGLGLGKIIAKLSEKDVKFDPGLTQQIHLINNVRIISVHSKKDAFYPSKGQTQAMILYTLDVLRKLF